MLLRNRLLALTIVSFLPACSSTVTTTTGQQPLADAGPSSGGSSTGGVFAGGGSGASPSSGGSTVGGSGGAIEGVGGAVGGSGGVTVGGSGGAVNMCSTGALTKPESRSAGASCSPSAIPFLDAGASCAADAANQCPGGTCLRGACSFDQCLTDSDCSPGFACVCGDTFYGGNGIHGNVCVQAQCRSDADCGASEACTISFSERCGAPSGIFCHYAADTCGTDADCCNDTPSCRYQPTLGHWACQGATFCNG